MFARTFRLPLTTPSSSLRLIRPPLHRRHQIIFVLFSTSVRTMAIIEHNVGRAADLKDGDLKEVPFGNSAVLLSKVNGHVYATSPKCTHYGAPLAKGVLSSNGRITCPWHGACFNATSGDIVFRIDRYEIAQKHNSYAVRKISMAYNHPILIPCHLEDAPALDNLNKYEVFIKDGDIYVTVNEDGKKPVHTKFIQRIPIIRLLPFSHHLFQHLIFHAALKVGRRRPARNIVTKDNNKTVIILGGGASGSMTAEHLREQGFGGKIVIVSRESYLPIDRPKLSKMSNIGDASKIQLRDAAFWEELDVKFLLSTDAQSVDTKAKTVTLSTGSQLSYDTLVLATGGHPRTIPAKGVNLQNVFTLRTVNNSNAISEAIKSTTSRPALVVIGSSFIGMEVASVYAKDADVTVIGRDKVPFQRVLGKDVGEALHKLHVTNGIKFYMEAGVSHLEAKTADSTSVGYVVLTSGIKISADVVVLGTGVGPQTDYLKGNDAFELQRDGSLKVDKYFRVEGHEEVYAAGDIARFHWDLTGEDLRVEHWSHAENTGRLVALNILGKKKTFDKVPYFWTAQHGKSIRYTGYASSFDDVIIQGSTEELSFVAFYVRGEKVVAVLSLNKDPVVSHSNELLRHNKYPTATDLRNGKNVLDIKI
ncbi:hypothetical protein BC936DRAFT_148571 [Jimgerdemannia flammicorona]|uniref:Rieske domain-containing protein n=1 Tax=Jimgerdemannia flammicorona TaxID=994334 RepID=A0A433DKW7_9FUNG|nr:hypothetical protein BC936DRAFT_148571 [Jimgerdemannia flammicorona]